MRRNWLEWLVVVVSVLAIVALVGFLVVDGLTEAGRPVAIEIVPHPDRARSGPSGWLLPATVRNVGGEAASSLVVEARATVGGEEEASEVRLDLLAADSEAEIVVGFSGPPDGPAGFRVVGFEVP